jgi:hypothetical protein
METKKIKIRPFLCHDCIGEVISFISSSEIFFNVLLCNKSINKEYNFSFGTISKRRRRISKEICL